MIIYKITNKENGKIYIGKTKFTVEERWKEHLKCLTRTKKDNNKFYNAIRKYGEESFILEIIEEVDNEELLNEREIYWIAELNAMIDGYNSKGGGEGGSLSQDVKDKIGKANLGWIPSDETRKIWSKQRKGKQTGKDHPLFEKTFSDETKEKMRKAKLGKVGNRLGTYCSEETKEKLREIRKNQVFTQETIDKRSESNRGKKRSPEIREKMRLAQLKRFSLNQEKNKK